MTTRYVHACPSCTKVTYGALDRLVEGEPFVQFFARRFDLCQPCFKASGLDPVPLQSELPMPAYDLPAAKVRRAASDTSRQAALENLPRSGTQRERILHLLAANRDGGMTDFQLAAGLALNPNSERPRRVELVEGGWVEDSGQRRPSPTDNAAVVWRLTDRARRELHHPEGGIAS